MLPGWRSGGRFLRARNSRCRAWPSADDFLPWHHEHAARRLRRLWSFPRRMWSTSVALMVQPSYSISHIQLASRRTCLRSSNQSSGNSLVRLDVFQMGLRPFGGDQIPNGGGETSDHREEGSPGEDRLSGRSPEGGNEDSVRMTDRGSAALTASEPEKTDPKEVFGGV